MSLHDIQYWHSSYLLCGMTGRIIKLVNCLNWENDQSNTIEKISNPFIIDFCFWHSFSLCPSHNS